MKQQALEKSGVVAGEEHPSGFLSKQSAIGSVEITKRAEYKADKSVALAAHVKPGSSWSAVEVREPRGHVEGKEDSIPGRESVQEGQSVTVLSQYMKPSSCSSSGINFPGRPTSSSSKFEERNLQLVSPNSERHPLNGPALKIIWKGCFKIPDFTSENRICERFMAHASAKISRKAHDFARQIAGVLQFRIHPRRAFWPEIFKSDCPDANDIALYFYPERIERPKQQYASLLKLIERQDLMLRSHMGHVELLVFPSKLLHADSQKLDGNYFMWGVFRCLKDEKVANKAEVRPTLL